MTEPTASTDRRPLVLAAGEGRGSPLVPGGVIDDFETRGDERAGMLNVPGDFEAQMPAIADSFTEHPPADASC